MPKVTGYADPFHVRAFMKKYAPELLNYCVGYQIVAQPLGQPIELSLTLAVDPSVFEELSPKEFGS